MENIVLNVEKHVLTVVFVKNVQVFVKIAVRYARIVETFALIVVNIALDVKTIVITASLAKIVSIFVKIARKFAMDVLIFAWNVTNVKIA